MRTATSSFPRRHRTRRTPRTLRTQLTPRCYSSAGDCRWRYQPLSADIRSSPRPRPRSSPRELREPQRFPRTQAPLERATATPALTAAKRFPAARTSPDTYGRTRASNHIAVNTASAPSRYPPTSRDTCGISTTRRGRSGVVTATAASASRRTWIGIWRSTRRRTATTAGGPLTRLISRRSGRSWAAWLRAAAPPPPVPPTTPDKSLEPHSRYNNLVDASKWLSCYGRCDFALVLCKSIVGIPILEAICETVEAMILVSIAIIKQYGSMYSNNTQVSKLLSLTVNVYNFPQYRSSYIRTKISIARWRKQVKQITVVATKSAIRCMLFCIINKVILQVCVLNVNNKNRVRECTEFPLPI